MIILDNFSYFSIKNIYCGYSSEVPRQGAYVFMENWGKLSHNYHLILLNNFSVIDHHEPFAQI